MSKKRVLLTSDSNKNSVKLFDELFEEYLRIADKKTSIRNCNTFK